MIFTLPSFPSMLANKIPLWFLNLIYPSISRARTGEVVPIPTLVPSSYITESVKVSESDHFGT